MVWEYVPLCQCFHIEELLHYLITVKVMSHGHTHFKFRVILFLCILPNFIFKNSFWIIDAIDWVRILWSSSFFFFFTIMVNMGIFFLCKNMSIFDALMISDLTSYSPFKHVPVSFWKTLLSLSISVLICPKLCLWFICTFTVSYYFF